MSDKAGTTHLRHGADTPRPRLAWLAVFQAAVITLVIAATRFARTYTGDGTLEDRLERLRQAPLEGSVHALAWDGRSWVTGLVAMVGALALMLPIAWAYVVTRERKRVDHSVVATITLMPMAVAAILVIVQNSLAVAFSLAGIAGVVRFRNALEDSKDAMYVVVALAVGLGAGVGAMEASATLSALYNLVVVALWKWNTEPPQIAEIALDEHKGPKGRSWLRSVLHGHNTVRHPEPVAEWLQPEERTPLMPGAQQNGDSAQSKRDGVLRVQAAEDLATRQVVEQVLEECTKHWSLVSDEEDADNLPALTYQVRLKKRFTSEDLLARL